MGGGGLDERASSRQFRGGGFERQFSLSRIQTGQGLVRSDMVALLDEDACHDPVAGRSNPHQSRFGVDKTPCDGDHGFRCARAWAFRRRDGWRAGYRQQGEQETG